MEDSKFDNIATVIYLSKYKPVGHTIEFVEKLVKGTWVGLCADRTITFVQADKHMMDGIAHLEKLGVITRAK